MATETYSIEEAGSFLGRMLQEIAAKILFFVNIALAALCVFLSVTLLHYFTFSSTRGLQLAEAVLKTLGAPIYNPSLQLSFTFANNQIVMPRAALVRVRPSFLEQENELVFTLNWRHKNARDKVIVVLQPYSLDNNAAKMQSILIPDIDKSTSKTLENGDKEMASRQERQVFYRLSRRGDQPTVFKCQKTHALIGTQCVGVYHYQQNFLVQYRFAAGNLNDWTNIEAAINAQLDSYIQ